MFNSRQVCAYILHGNMSEPFDCVGCKTSLYGRRFILVKEQPHCVPCYDKLCAKTCAGCGQPIGHDSMELFFEDKHYHERCLRCFHCQLSLADQAFSSQEGALLCKDCHSREFATQCHACNMPILPGTRRLELDGVTWHDACFICQSCKKPIGSQGFFPHKGQYFCVACHENKMSPRCKHCKQALPEGGVIYQGVFWHRKCLLCASCRAPLADQSFTSHQDKPHCLSCYNRLYTNNCEACGEPITGQEEVKYITFGERQWHRACFTCSLCTVSLVGVGFYSSNDRILCGDCNRTQ
ncbi:four and a half LIM domains protein 3-like isoform X1 [Paramormyrops kingsleyae]